MCLKNFKQLENLGYDIITLSTTDLLPSYIIEKSKHLIYDYTSHKCNTKFYYDYYKASGGGYFMYDVNSNHKVMFYHNTHFPSLLRNYRSLVSYAKCLGYENYFYIEDDHFIHSHDFCNVRNYIDKLNEYDLITFCFQRLLTCSERVYATYFNIGKVNTMFDIIKNAAYTEYEYKNTDVDIYGQFFETVFTKLVTKYKSENCKILEETTSLNDIFKYSSINQVYSYRNLIDDARCNFIHDLINNKPVFYYSSVMLTDPVQLKIYIGNVCHENTTIYPGCWYYSHIDANLIGKTKIVINDKLVKTFDESQNFIYNGELFFHS
jgi:hypothetical protein